MPLVVLTYPGHFFFTTLTIRSFLKYHATPDQIYIVADDLSPHAWPDYVGDCQQHYHEFGACVIGASRLETLQAYNKNGWIRQQIIKLCLDQLVNFETCFYTDGDIIFLNAVDPDCVPYSEPGQGNIGQLNQSYVSAMLDIANPGISVNNKSICVSNPAFRTLESRVLQQLRQAVETKTQQKFDLTHVNYQTQDTSSVSEWELIENFKLHKLGRHPNLVKYAPHDYTAVSQPLTFFKHQFLTCYGTDQTIGANWFASQGVTDLDRYWNKIEKISR